MQSFYLTSKCTKCGARFDAPILPSHCPHCQTELLNAGLETVYDYSKVRQEVHRRGSLGGRGSGLWQYANLLPVTDENSRLSLGEGNTPVVRSNRLDEFALGARVSFKVEYMNPTMSYKDRHCCVSVSKALELKRGLIAVSSTGNHGLSAAAYAARAHLPCLVLTTPQISDVVRAQLAAYGARVCLTDSMEVRWDIVREGVKNLGWWPIGNLVSPPAGVETYGVDGYKTISFEAYEQCSPVPEYVACPVSFGDGLFGIWKGFNELVELGLMSQAPAMIAVECSYGGALTNAMMKGLSEPVPVQQGEPSIALTISVTNSAFRTLRCLKDSRGTAVQVSDGDIFEAQHCLACEGLYVEPTSAAALAGVRRLRMQGFIKEGSTVLVILTSAGIKHQEHVLGNLKPFRVVHSLSEALTVL